MRLSTIARGILAGAVGTAAMTAHQTILQRLARENEQPQEAEPSTNQSEKDPWETAPAPAQVGKRLIEGVVRRRVPAEAIPALTQAMHWSYGSAWGSAFAITRESVRGRASLLGPLFGLGVWAASYVQLVPLGIYDPLGPTRPARSPTRSATTSPTASPSRPPTGFLAGSPRRDRGVRVDPDNTSPDRRSIAVGTIPIATGILVPVRPCSVVRPPEELRRHQARVMEGHMGHRLASSGGHGCRGAGWSPRAWDVRCLPRRGPELADRRRGCSSSGVARVRARRPR